jgi:hypothetical protein
MLAKLFPTSLVGSYPQPDWLIDRARLSKMVPRVRMDDLWLVDPKALEAKQDEATLLAIQEQERAGLDIITDGEQRRESYSNRFATALEGVDTENPGSTLNRSGKPIPVPRVTGKIHRKYPVELRDLQFLRANTKKTVKMTVPGPFTMSKQAQNEFYKTDESMALDYAAAVNEEIKDLFAAGAGGGVGQRLANASGDDLRRLYIHVGQIDDTEDDRFRWQLFENFKVKLRLGRLDGDLLSLRTFQFRQKRIASRLVMHDSGIAKAQMDRDRSADAVECTVERLQAIFARLVGVLLHPRFIDLCLARWHSAKCEQWCRGQTLCAMSSATIRCAAA